MVYYSNGFDLRAANLIDQLNHVATGFSEPKPDYRFSVGLKNGGWINVQSADIDPFAQAIDIARRSSAGRFSMIDIRSSNDLPTLTLLDGYARLPVITYGIRLLFHESDVNRLDVNGEDWYTRTNQTMRDIFEETLDNHILNGPDGVPGLGLKNHVSAHREFSSISWRNPNDARVVMASWLAAATTNVEITQEAKASKPNICIMPRSILNSLNTTFATNGDSRSVKKYLLEENDFGINNFEVDARLKDSDSNRDIVLFYNKSKKAASVFVPRWLTFEEVVNEGLGKRSLIAYFSTSAVWVEPYTLTTLYVPQGV